MKKLSVIGHFGFGHEFLDGQTIKTKTVTEELERVCGSSQILKTDTCGGAKNLLKAPFQVLRALKNSKNVLIFPAQNGLRVYAPLLAGMRMLFRDRRIHYAVIGGWLPGFLAKRRILAKALGRFDGIYVETLTMQTKLKEQGFDNVYVMPNCKKLETLSEDELVYPSGMPYKLCTFSRVMKEKGIRDAAAAVAELNEEAGRQIFVLDIYGRVADGQQRWFDELQRQYSDHIRYRGCVSADRSVSVLKDYFALIFPTRFYTEGIPGTIVDSYAAGVPVIGARWESFADVVDEGETGIGYEFCNPEDLKRQLAAAANDPSVISGMKRNCLKKSGCYTPSAAVKTIINRLA